MGYHKDRLFLGNDEEIRVFNIVYDLEQGDHVTGTFDYDLKITIPAEVKLHGFFQSGNGTT